MRLYYTNLIDASGVSITASSAATALPVTNVAHEHKSRVWRTLASSAVERATFDLGASTAATTCIIHAHNLKAGDTVTIRKSTDNFAANDVSVATFTHSTGPMKVDFSSTSSRYWRVEITKTLAAETRDIGRIFLGAYVELATPPDWDGFKATPHDRSQIQKSVGGQTYVDSREQYRTFTVEISGLAQSDMTAVKTFTEDVGTATSFFVIADQDSVAGTEPAELVYVKNRALPARDTDGLDATGAQGWATKFEFEEQL